MITRLKASFGKFAAGDRSSLSLLAALVLVALVPVVGVLWFMTVAMRNERLAVQARLTEVYSTHLASLQGHVTAFANERQEALQSVAGFSPAERFEAIVRANLADTVVVYDAAGKVVYPAAANVEIRMEENADWARARELEFQKADFAGAAEAYGRVAGSSRDIHARARALQSQAACLLKAEQKERALGRLAELVSDESLRNAVSAQGAWIVPNAQLLALKILSALGVGPALAAVPQLESRGGMPASGSPTMSRQQQALDDLVQRLKDYPGGDLPSSQRRFLMAEVMALAPGKTNLFPTLAAEELAAEYLEHNPALPTDSKLQPTPLAKVWRLPGANGTVVALFREERLRAEIAKQLDPLALPDARVSVWAPGDAVASVKLVASQEIGGLLPGWRLGLSFRDGDPLATASARQTRFYLWTGVGVVLIIAVVALLVARYVSAQMRLARLKNELVSAVSHELRTPLASMRALVDTLLARRYSDPRQLDEYLQLVAKENLRLSQLIENFLTFSRLERGQQHFRFAEVAPEAVVSRAVEVLKEKLASAGCHFEARIDSDLPPIRADADALSTVLVNLLDNAWKYTDGEKRIRARAYARGGSVCFEIADNGIGLERSEARKIFDRFYQVDQSLTRQRGGCGLGLSIVQSIVRAHGGTVEVESEPGKGSTFRVKIPVSLVTTLNAQVTNHEAAGGWLER